MSEDAIKALDVLVKAIVNYKEAIDPYLGDVGTLRDDDEWFKQSDDKLFDEALPAARQVLANPDHENLDFDAVLQDWYSVDHILFGMIMDDKKNRFPNGKLVRTSTVQGGMIDGEFRSGEIVTTRNTRYLLGRKRVA